MRKRNHQRGVTLIETLVALAIMGIAASAILVMIAQNTRFTADARERTFAAVAADNLMVETLLDARRLDTGEEIGNAAYRNFEWEFRRRISETPVDDIIRIDIAIYNQTTGQALATISTLRDRS